MKTVIESLQTKIKRLEYDIEYNLKSIKSLNEDIKELSQRNEDCRTAIDEATTALNILKETA